MPRRPLLVLTALVLALHWLVLQGVPLVWQPTSAPAATQVFSTRSIAPPPPPQPAAKPADGGAHTPVARKRPAPRPAPHAPRVADATPPPEPPPSTPTAELAAEPGPDTSAAAAGAAPLPEAPSSDTGAAAPQPAASADMAPPAPPASPASAAEHNNSTDTGAGVDITPPGGSPGSSASTAAPAVRLPPPVRLGFDVNGQAKKFDYKARAELVWQHDGSRYEARQEVSAFLVGTRSQSSVGQVTPQGLQPERFADRSRSEQAAHFDHAQKRVTFSANTPNAALGAGAQDRLSVFIQLGALLAADPGRFVQGTQITLTTVSARSADRWTFSVEGQETLDLPAGPTPALKLQRLPRRDYDQKAELWLAPALGYLPVRIRLTQANGDFADLRLRSSGPP